ncbi:NAD-dependent epimerase/dehydratase family protein [Dyella telluris]|uniref:NAD-dependent epimerase/dehydratase family protein n=1 Tax=Dyella telluris TaxID=2763498 RepID=A0A7G8Q749_9GAMM|nr:NAD-dependent epimerase/dehydratase family protein [Dyella telluris]QNK02607.1 NAD-dependent epimerase/dehydratase family protein [Dyella telluris]
MSARVLVAGAGDVGLRVARLLRARGDAVWALRRGAVPPGEDGIRWIRGDLTRPDTLGEVPRDLSHIVYLPTPDARDEALYRAVFVDGLRHLLDRVDHATLQRLLFVSSSAVYGEHGDAWVDEETPPDPPGFNGRVLLEAEHQARQRAPSVVLRLAGLYGPGRLQLIERLRAGTARVPHDPPHWANRIHVDDAAAGIVHLLFLPHAQPLYLGVDDTPLPLDVLYGDLARRVHAPEPGEGAPPPGIGSKRLSNARLRASGFAPQWPDARDGYAALLKAADTSFPLT